MRVISLRSGVWATVLCLGCVAAAEGGIGAISPAEGTLGTRLVVSGAGFGAKRGSVLIGNDKCQVLAWSDGRIECYVSRPQPAGRYPVTVLAQGEKRPSAPMTFTAFAMRPPRIAPPGLRDLVFDGVTVTLGGAFFGDKKGDIVLSRAGAAERAKIVDWTMESVRFELPPGSTGTYLLEVSNAVGGDAALIRLPAGGVPSLESTYQGLSAKNNSSGAYFNGKFFVFSIHWDTLNNAGDNLISAGTYLNGLLTEEAITDGGHTDAQVVPLVTPDKLWVFHTGHDGKIYFTRYSASGGWESSWRAIPGVTTRHDWEVAPVYNPATQRIEVYYESDDHLNWVSGDDDGTMWVAGSRVLFGSSGSPIPIATAPGAVFYDPPSADPVTLVGYGSESWDLTSVELRVAAVRGGLVTSSLSGDAPTLNARPFLMDAGPDFIFVVWKAQSQGNPVLAKLDKATGEIVDPGTPLTTIEMNWAPNLAVDFEPDAGGGTDRIVYLFWGDDVWGGTVWMMTPILNLGR